MHKCRARAKVAQSEVAAVAPHQPSQQIPEVPVHHDHNLSDVAMFGHLA